ncbi:UDP-N-acetylglucosamine transferase subunit ALG13 [Microbacterium terrae]|uniref:UDP-N-acetylglucosamine--N-acetylmuramyl-(Pentapeptide) pyrophosphoryl-undecaprenol N-acetylglucosamine transferase n=1 Tax=Microbacterium terrae TaxID=69369 RepID=A0A0M2H3T3_9MICO|nr:glycosyltransferase [Microbacterium terrae]KJL38465.1 UDP-N-acetylglucosamine--N-acetylmuramyl-(pentapeptide) pyrophosphoryl-undecaprenol N-acetylglucosamine transferase [Microbacterium terrae]MBP1078892.1 UDP-N-acetylglucosamine transferase subunit ALG13 [Microbacterium terrae]GLJ98292.1 glycosyl transferase [Microbacterium terrae]
MAKTMMVCSGGGHLKQLYTLAERLGVPAEDQVWITFENGLSTSLLADREVHYAPFVAPRDVRNLWRLRSMAGTVMRSHEYERAFSTGSSPAVAVLPMAAARGAQAHYIESAARAVGPSITGRILERFPRIRTYTQYPAWQSSRWAYAGSIYDGFTPSETITPAPDRIRRAVVTVGTQEGYGFDRLFDALAPLLADADEVLWQTGPQDVSSWGIDGRDRVPHDELSAAIAEADVVIAHAGTGSAIAAFEQGRFPVLVPRLAQHREHVDDHQVQIAREMQRRGLAFMRTPDQLDETVLLEAARRSVDLVSAPPLRVAA